MFALTPPPPSKPLEPFAPEPYEFLAHEELSLQIQEQRERNLHENVQISEHTPFRVLHKRFEPPLLPEDRAEVQQQQQQQQSPTAATATKTERKKGRQEAAQVSSEGCFAFSSNSQLFENFVVLGLAPSSSSSSSSSSKNATADQQPTVLWQFPHQSIKPLPPGLINFCFPGAMQVQRVRRTPSCSGINEILYKQSAIYSLSNSFIFCLSTAPTTTCNNPSPQVPSRNIVPSLQLSQAHSSASSTANNSPRITSLPLGHTLFLKPKAPSPTISPRRTDQPDSLQRAHTLSSSFPSAIRMPTDEDDSSSPAASRSWYRRSAPQQSKTKTTHLSGSHRSSFHSLSSLSPSSPSQTTSSSSSTSTNLGLVSVAASDQFLSTCSFNVTPSSSPQPSPPISPRVTSSRSRSPSPPSPLSLPSQQLNSSPFSLSSASLPYPLFGICVVQNELLAEPASFISSHSLQPPTADYENKSKSYECNKNLKRLRNFFSTEQTLESTIVNSRVERPTSLPIVARILEQYYSQSIPTPGHSLKLDVGFGIPPFSFDCPSGSGDDVEAQLVAKWCFVSLFRHLSLENIILLFSAALLEKQMFVSCKKLGLLSSTVLSISPMLWPLKWQGLCVPTISNNMYEYLEAPVPYIIGVTMNLSELSQVVKPGTLTDVIAVLPETDRLLTHKSICIPPANNFLYNNLKPYHTFLQENAPEHPFRASKKDIQAVESIISAFRFYMKWFLGKIKAHYLSFNMEATPASIMRATFLETVKPRNKEFVASFLSTQHFDVWFTQVLMNTKQQQ